jgi:hypothetical protein
MVSPSFLVTRALPLLPWTLNFDSPDQISLLHCSDVYATLSLAQASILTMSLGAIFGTKTGDKPVQSSIANQSIEVDVDSG